VVDGFFIVGELLQPPRAEIDDSIRTLAIVSAIGLLLAGVASWIVSGQILAPLRLVRRTAEEITEDDLTRRIPVTGNDDLSALADRFNAMLDRLSRAFATQREFVDDAGHELRTPITIIRGNLEVMGDDPAERAEVVRLCTDELDRMSRIVEDLLVLAKSERPDFVRQAPVELAELTSDIDAKVRSLADRHWVLESCGDGEVCIDAQRITQAVVQFAQNAVQHTAAGATIRIGSAVRRQAGVDTVAVWVADTGPGVRAEDAESIFERFSRGSTGGARNHRSGAGLGLAIVRAIAEAHGGRIRLDSTPGAGARFTIEVPATPPAG
jgi:two-component system OmpR family sensor kinase